ncbi:MAG: rod shape-determining protein MreC [Verrucomicrobiales bacterium]|nr:rod shape-determining protein MreC [Verrucomicrobiales bacterium]
MFKRPQYIAFGVVLFLVLIFLSLPGRTATQIKIALGSLFLPLFGLAGSAQHLTDQTGSSMRSKRALVAEIEQLRLENDRLRVEAAQQAQVWEENDRLRQALAWQRQKKWNLKAARVILRDPANWWRTIRIDLGLQDGIATNMPVLTAEGLVGKVWQVGFNSSQVVLIGDPKCSVSALVEGTEKPGSTKKTAVDGVITSVGASVLDPSVVVLTFLDRQSAVKPGQRVITSGMGGVFPRGIPIGQIAETRSIDYGLYLDARVKLAANLAHLEAVFVMLP